jgi:hypothetical protein
VSQQVRHDEDLSLLLGAEHTVVDPKISKRGARSRKGGGGTPEIATKKNRVFGVSNLEFMVILDENGRSGPSGSPLNPSLA